MEAGGQQGTNYKTVHRCLVAKKYATLLTHMNGHEVAFEIVSQICIGLATSENALAISVASLLAHFQAVM